MESISYGLEGNSYMGKTTTFELLIQRQRCDSNVVIGVPEYSSLEKIPIFRREDKADIDTIVQFFLDLEKRRTDLAIKAIAAANQDTIVLFDRTPISLILFEVAIGRTNQARHATAELAEGFQRAIQDEEIIVPARIVHLTATPATFEGRRLADLAKGRGDCIPLLLESITRDIFEEGTRLWESLFGQQLYHCIQVDDMHEEAVATTLATVLTANLTCQETGINLVCFTKAVLALDIR